MGLSCLNGPNLTVAGKYQTGKRQQTSSPAANPTCRACSPNSSREDPEESTGISESFSLIFPVSMTTPRNDLAKEAYTWGLGTIQKAQSPGSGLAGATLSLPPYLLPLNKLMKHPGTPSPPPHSKAFPPPPLQALTSSPLY